MYLPKKDRAAIWDDWSKQPDAYIKLFASKGLGDQAFLEARWLDTAARWQDRLPNQFVSFKVHCKNGVPHGARVIVYHGKPRPWALNGQLQKAESLHCL
jgi:hypothetical protein